MIKPKNNNDKQLFMAKPGPFRYDERAMKNSYLLCKSNLPNVKIFGASFLITEY